MEELSPAARTYVRATAVTMSLYVVLSLGWVATVWLGLKWPVNAPFALTVATSFAIAVHLWALLRLVQRSDEFMRTIMAKRSLTAAMIVIGGVTIWGLFQTAGWVAAFPLPLIYFLFFVVHAALIPFINADRA